MIYCKFSRLNWLERDFGTEITGEIFTDRRRTIPHDLGSYTELRLKLFRKNESFNYINVPVTKVQGDGNEHKWSYVVKQGDFRYEGIYYIVIAGLAQGIQNTTYPEEFYVGENGDSGEL